MKRKIYSRSDVEPLFTADTHFFHKNILKFCPKTRQGGNAAEMSYLIRDNWNAQVAPDQDVYHLGEVGLGASEAVLNVSKKLNGRIHLITGNHDNAEYLRRTGIFASVRSYAEITIRDYNFVLFHYPIFEWNGIHKGYIHLYGHVHGRELPLLPEGRSMDVGIDTRPNGDMKLWTVQEILDIVLPKPIRIHHEGEQ